MSVAAAADLRARRDRSRMYGIAGWHPPQAPGSAIGEEEPGINPQLFGVPLAKQLKGLQRNLFDAGFDCNPEEPMACPANRCCRPNWLSPSPLAMFNPAFQSELHRIVELRGSGTGASTQPRRLSRAAVIYQSHARCLTILRELWTETKDERFFRVACLFRP